MADTPGEKAADKVKDKDLTAAEAADLEQSAVEAGLAGKGEPYPQQEPIRDGVQEIDDRQVYAKTFRVGAASHEVYDEMHANNMRMTVDEMHQRGVPVAGEPSLYRLVGDGASSLITYIVPTR